MYSLCAFVQQQHLAADVVLHMISYAQMARNLRQHMFKSILQLHFVGYWEATGISWRSDIFR